MQACGQTVPFMSRDKTVCLGGKKKSVSWHINTLLEYHDLIINRLNSGSTVFHQDRKGHQLIENGVQGKKKDLCIWRISLCRYSYPMMDLAPQPNLPSYFSGEKFPACSAACATD